MYQHILIPLENSATDQVILDHVKPLVKLTGAKLLLLHVADGWVARNFNQLKLAESEEMKNDREYLEKVAGQLRSDGFSVETMLALGDPPDEILKVAEGERCDLIAMAGHNPGSRSSGRRERLRVPCLLTRASNLAAFR